MEESALRNETKFASSSRYHGDCTKPTPGHEDLSYMILPRSHRTHPIVGTSTSTNTHCQTYLNRNVSMETNAAQK